MHALPRLRLPHLIGVSAAAAVLAIVISLAFAASLSPLNRSGDTMGSPDQPITAAPAAALPAVAPRWAADPFANLLGRPLPQVWRAARH